MSIAAHGQPAPLEFGKSPAQWLMTAEEKKAWRDVRTEDRAKEFADLFFARRDPTPGTYPNEFRAEFNRRVEYADAHFKEARNRGAFTERGRVLITLGFPKNMGAEATKRSGQHQSSSVEGSGASDATGGRTMEARDVWEYERSEAVKYGMPKIEVVFLHDGYRDSVRRDPQRTDFTSALPTAIKYYIRNANLTSVPEWAKIAAVQFQGSELAGASAAERTETVTTYNTVTKRTIVDTQPVGVTRPAGAGRLTLVADAFEIQPQRGGDPFSSLSPLGVFKRDGDLGWAAEYCTGDASGPVPSVDVTLKISGLIRGVKINFNSPPEEMVPDQIKAVPGCYLVRGAIPLAEMDPGNYTLFVKIGPYNLTKEFRLEQ